MKFIIIILIFVLSSCSKKLLFEPSEISILNFGAIPDDDVDDSQAFIKAFDFIQNSNMEPKIIIPKGTFNIYKRLDFTDFTENIYLRGESESIIKVPEHGLFYFRPKYFTTKILLKAVRGANEIVLENVSNVKVGDVIRLYSNANWESGWGYKENDTHIISHISGNVIQLGSKLVFNYDPAKEDVKLEISKSAKLVLQNLNLLIESSSEWKKTEAIVCTSLIVEIDNVNIKDHMENIFHRGFSLVNCPKVDITNIVMENLEYGILMNYCRDIKVNSIVAKRLRHAIAPANACINIYATDIIGDRCQGVIDAHQSFNIHYNNVRDKNATQFSNCRALGTKVTNSVFSVDTAFYQDYCYWSNQLLTDEYKFLYKEYDTEFDNVEWIHSKPSGFNGLTSFSCRDFIVKNCKSHNISVYGELYGKAIVSNSVLGTIRINSTEVNIDSTIMDGNLFKNAPYVFRFSGPGKAILNNVKVVNYNDNVTDMFEFFYNTSNVNSIEIFDSEFTSLRKWTNQFIYPNLDYTTLKMNNCSFKGFRVNLPKNIFASKNLSNHLQKVSGLNLNQNAID